MYNVKYLFSAKSAVYGLNVIHNSKLIGLISIEIPLEMLWVKSGKKDVLSVQESLEVYSEAF